MGNLHFKNEKIIKKSKDTCRKTEFKLILLLFKGSNELTLNWQFVTKLNNKRVESKDGSL